MRYRSILFHMVLSSILMGQSNAVTYFRGGLKNTVSTKGNQMILAAGLIGAGLAYQKDNAVLSYAQSSGLMPNQLAVAGDYWGAGGQILLWGAILTSENKSEEFRFASTAFVANGLLTYGLKFGVGRQRPDGRNKRAFPSGHTSNSFLTATIAQEIYGSKVGIPAYMMACVTGLSRIHDNKHYLSDVIFGAALGTAVGKGFGRVYRDSKNRRVGIIPQNQNLQIVLVWQM
ncbi:MAG: phosphatase PAP2 family protein [Candidatus Marinimicrobia bacterium]|nr:phosphatase PAP2 family protein [Candidatus Neomarinimicrobiota bacterium]